MSNSSAEPDFDRILAVKQAAQTRLLAIPGVHAVGVGAKIVGGERTAEPSIMVFLVKKKPLSELAPHEVIPSEIDGIKTDIVEVGMARTLAAREEDPDDDDYWKLGSINLKGGMQIQAARSPLVGTLGCIARTADQPDPLFVGVTCHHVVALRIGLPTTLTAVVSPDQHTITFGGGNTPGSLVVANLTVLPAAGGAGEDLDAFWVTTALDTLASIADNVKDRIKGLANPGVQATSLGNTVTILAQPGFVVQTGCQIFDSHSADPSAKLHASIQGNVISFAGQVEGEYGIYTNLNLGGAQPSQGIFTAVDKQNDLASVASLIASSINALHLTTVNAVPAGAQVTVNGAKELECDVVSDLRVGQPVDSFCSKCCWCCNDRIGRIFDARLSVDTALVRLDPGIGFSSDILEIGTLKGVHSITDAEAINGTYPVKKRGRTTRLTTGAVVATHVDGEVGTTLVRDDKTKSNIFHRHYTDAMWVQPDGTQQSNIFNIDGHDVAVFADSGDSGAALVNAGNEIVGMIFGGITRPNGDHWGVATPIEAITSAFSALGITIETATPVEVPTPVPIAAPAPGGAHAFAATSEPADDRDRLREMEREITSTPAGRKYAELIRRHFAEAQTLVNTNRRVATVWHRGGGPRILQGLLQMFQRPDQALPAEIDGRPLPECMLKIQRAFMRYGSRGLSADLGEFGPSLGRLAGLTYPEALSALRTMAVE